MDVQRFIMIVSKMMSMVFFLGFIIGVVAESPFTCSISAIFVFGDSLTDTGNIAYLGLNLLRYPYGMSYTFPGSINPSRFSDGRLVIDFFGILAYIIQIVHRLLVSVVYVVA
jgi:hypothetical protein